MWRCICRTATPSSPATPWSRSPPPYTALTGPRVVAGAATADEKQAINSLDAIEATDATHVLPGHGDPWGRGVGRAVAAARRNGMA